MPKPSPTANSGPGFDEGFWGATAGTTAGDEPYHGSGRRGGPDPGHETYADHHPRHSSVSRPVPRRGRSR